MLFTEPQFQLRTDHSERLDTADFRLFQPLARAWSLIAVGIVKERAFPSKCDFENRKVS